jgi:Zn-dependent protease with chaperone function
MSLRFLSLTIVSVLYASAALSGTASGTEPAIADASRGPVAAAAPSVPDDAPVQCKLLRRATGYVSRYDLATREELLLDRPVRQLFASDNVEQWPVVGELAGQFGDLVTQSMDAHFIAKAITSGMPLAGQDATQPISDIVDDCARCMGMKSPAVFISSNPRVFAYSGQAGPQSVLVLTSGLLDLYRHRDDELRFVVGRELGHLKCGHFRLRQASYGILCALHALDLGIVPKKYQNVAPSLATSRFFSWCREAEISADRAGLLCSGSPAVAYAAMQRQLHGLPSDSPWLAKGEADFKPDALLKEFRQWESQPFVKVVLNIQQSPQESPFIPERIVALQHWANSHEYDEIVSRRKAVPRTRSLSFESLALMNLGTAQEPVDVYLIAYDERDNRLFKTRTALDVQSVRWNKLSIPYAHADGAPLYFEIWQDNSLSDALLAGFVMYPSGTGVSYSAPVLWDWKDRSSTARAAVAQLTVKVAEPVKNQTPARKASRVKRK